jgi:hypothetical protein
MVAIAAVTLSLAACGTVDKYLSVVTQSNLDAAKTGYAPVLAAAANYNELPRCAAGQSATLAVPCSVYANVKIMRDADKQVSAGFDQAQADINACNPGVSGITTKATGSCSALTADYHALTALITTTKSTYSNITGKTL